MIKREPGVFFLLLAAAMLLSLSAALNWRPEPHAPDDAKALAAWLASHPADGAAATALTENALDADSAQRFQLWRVAHRHAQSLDPLRPDARIALLRSAFFHWGELDERDRKMVLAEAEPLLRNAQTFGSMAPPLWRLTHDFAFLRRGAGNTYPSLIVLRDIAATNGLFDEYRKLRDEVNRARVIAFKARKSETDPTDDLPRAWTTDDQPFVDAFLADVHENPIDKRPSNPLGTEALIDYAVRHGVGPLDGLEFVARDSGSVSAPARARLAIALGDAKRADLVETGAGADAAPIWTDYYRERAAYERAHGDAAGAASYLAREAATRKSPADWIGRCGEEICTSARRTITIHEPRAYSITLARVASDEVAPYVELYADDARFGEGPIATEETFETPVLNAGEHRIDVRVVNPFTRNLAQRRVKVLRESGP